jgi:hypothetical protein
LTFYWWAWKESAVPAPARTRLLWLFALFLIGASNTNHITWRLPILLGGYAIAASGFLLVPLYYRWQPVLARRAASR